MAVDMFLKIEGPVVKGETKDKQRTGDIDVLSWSWGASNSGSAHVGGGQGAGKANFQDISVTLWFESSTAVLFGAVATGKHFDKATLFVRKAGGKQDDYIKITMEHCILTSVSFGGSGGEDRLTINASINFAKFNLEYFKQNDKGVVAADTTFQYDIAGNDAT